MVNAYPYLITIAHRAPTTIAVEIEFTHTVQPIYLVPAHLYSGRG